MTEAGKGRRGRGPQRQKPAELTIHMTERVPLAEFPAGARFKGYRRLHSNGSENGLRDVVKKRKISAGTRSAVGRRCRNTFASLKTCRKQGFSFWEYIKDRVSGLNVILLLADLIRRAAASRHGPACS